MAERGGDLKISGGCESAPFFFAKAPKATRGVQPRRAYSLRRQRRNLIGGLAALCAAILAAAPPVRAQDQALLNSLVKKGVLSDQEAAEIEAQDQKDYATTAANKITLAASIQKLTFYGDLRLRYELRDGATPAGPAGTGGAIITHGDSEDLSRWRYRLRLGLKGNLNDNFFFGFRLSTNPTNNRSGNVTFGHSDAAGPFGKNQSLLALDHVYLGWHATDDITLTGGQMPNPLYTTNLVWDDNINPAGAAEQWDHTFDNNWEAFATAGQFVYQAAAGNGITNGFGANSSNYNTFMYAEQAGFQYNFDPDTFFKGAATFYTYSGTVGSAAATSVAGLYSTNPLNLAAPDQNPSFYNGPFVGAASAPTTNVSGINDLAVLEVPMEYDFKIGPGAHPSASGAAKEVKNVAAGATGWEVPIRVYGDFAYNLEAGDRADEARAAIEAAQAQNHVGSHSTGNLGVTLPVSVPTGAGLTAANVRTNNQTLQSPTFEGVLDSGKSLLDQTAYQVGIELGELKKKGDWDGKVYWQSTGYYALDANLVSESFNGGTNLGGVGVSVSHEWTDGLVSTLTYVHADPVNDKLATPTIGQDLTIGDIHDYNLFQADLMWSY
jgi:hypothetical protein